MPFSDKLRQLRKNKNLTQAALALSIKMDMRTIRRYEAGTSVPSMAALTNIADFFQVNTDFLLDRTNDPAPLLPANAPLGQSDIRLADGHLNT